MWSHLFLLPELPDYWLTWYFHYRVPFCLNLNDYILFFREINCRWKYFAIDFFSWNYFYHLRLYCSCPRGRARIKFLPAWRKILARAAKPQGQEFYLQKGKNFIFVRPLGQEYYSYEFTLWKTLCFHENFMRRLRKTIRNLSALGKRLCIWYSHIVL